MTPKEKAKELVDIFYQTTPNEAWYNPPLGSLSMEYKSWEQAKQCALIAADEIINSNPTSQLSDPFLGNRTYENVNYWKDIKQEIEKL
jgi:hypothetical protein